MADINAISGVLVDVSDATLTSTGGSAQISSDVDAQANVANSDIMGLAEVAANSGATADQTATLQGQKQITGGDDAEVTVNAELVGTVSLNRVDSFTVQGDGDV